MGTMTRKFLLNEIKSSLHNISSLTVTADIVEGVYKSAPPPFDTFLPPLHGGHAGFERDIEEIGFRARYDPLAKTYLLTATIANPT